MSSGASDGSDFEAGRLGGARAEFVASLGRKISDARDLLSALEDDPASKLVRDELRRRLHALGAGARMLKLDALTRSLQGMLAVLENAADAGSLTDDDVGFVGQSLDDLPALAWGDATVVEAPDEADDVVGHAPITVLVVGGEELAEALMEEGVARARAFECERTDNFDSALQLARAYAPDLALLDADFPRASELVESLLDDPLTEPVPVVVVGTFREADDAARFVALGVAKTLAKPVTPEIIRGTCDEILDAREGRTLRVTLGEPTLEQLADRLAEEIRRALVDHVDRPALSRRVPLGEGTEVLGALWGAIARIQEIVSTRTGGAVRFGSDAPEGAVALAPWLHHDLAGSDRLAGRGRGAAADVRLKGRRVVVADDDPGVTWFISDLLRTAGCEVFEALDGMSALELSFRVQPELVVSDILMPGLDGFALCRALRRDVALRDTPVILLSWKEDLLQRVRELGVSAAAYMRKESDSRAVLARVREVLRPRARIEMRLRADGEVRGRLDGLSPCLLLELVGAIRRDARITIRDAMFFYEIDVRDGAPRRVMRTAADGQSQSGERALASLLGVGAGRFVVWSTSDPVRGDLSGTLSDLLARPVAAARGALASTTGSATMQVERIAIDGAVLGEYVASTPDPARSLVSRLAEGASPRQILLAGDVSPALLEDVLADLAARGAVEAVEGPDRVDLLSPAIEGALAAARGTERSISVLPPNARPSVPPAATVPKKRTSMPPRPLFASVPPRPSAPPVAASPAGGSARSFAAPAADAPGEPSPAPEADDAPQYETFKLSDPPPAPVEDEDAMPSSLEDAVMREISDRSPTPIPVQPSNARRSIVEPSELRPRSSNPPEDPEDSRPLPSIPPDAIVPEESLADAGANGTTFRSAFDPEAEARPGDLEGTPPLPMPADAFPLVRRSRPPSAERRAAASASAEPEEPYVAPFELRVPATPDASASVDAAPLPAVEDEGRAPLDGARLAGGREEALLPAIDEPADAPPDVAPIVAPVRRRVGIGWLVVAFVILGVAVAAGLYLSGTDAGTPRVPADPAASSAGSPSPP